MKKNIISLIIALFQIFAITNIAFAQWNNWQWNNSQGATSAQIGSGSVLVSEKPLGATCQCVRKEEKGEQTQYLVQEEQICTQKPQNRLYICEVPPFTTLIQGIVNWIIQIALLLGVLATAALGVAWTIAGGDNPEYKKKLKDWLVGLIVGLILIYGFQYILGIFGWIYVTNL